MPVLGSASAAASGANGNPNFRLMQPLGDNCAIDGLTFTPTALTGTYMVRHEISLATPTISFVYSNALGANPVTIKAGVVGPFGYAAMTFGGAQSVTIPVGTWVQTDPVSCPVEAGGFIRSLTYATIASGTLPAVVNLARTYGQEGFASGVDNASTGSLTNGVDYNATTAYGPSGVYGHTGQRVVIIGGIGDSITQGSGDSKSFGYFERAGSATFSFTREGRGGEGVVSTLSAQVTPRLTRLAGCTHILCASGRNGLSGTPTALSLATSLAAEWRMLAAGGAKVYQTTLTPQTTSSDSWATVGNQTLETNAAVRTAVNDWLRAGAKVDGSGVPVFDGSGTASTYLTGYVELADVVESARNSGKWKAGYTADGVHPTTATHTLMGTTVRTWVATLSA